MSGHFPLKETGDDQLSSWPAGRWCQEPLQTVPADTACKHVKSNVTPILEECRLTDMKFDLARAQADGPSVAFPSLLRGVNRGRSLRPSIILIYR